MLWKERDTDEIRQFVYMTDYSTKADTPRH